MSGTQHNPDEAAIRAPDTSGTCKPLREPFGRIDRDQALRALLLPFCRIGPGEIWEDSVAGHRVGVCDATDPRQVKRIAAAVMPRLCIADPPYNLPLGSRRGSATGTMARPRYDEFTSAWLDAVLAVMASTASLYVWLGADLRDNFRPLPEFLAAMSARREWEPRNWITLRNQRGYGTQANWMWVRQELLY